MDRPEHQGVFSAQDILIMKGVAIILIVFHNYFHWQKGLEIENEFFYVAGNFDKYLLGIQQGVDSFLRYSFAYFGHLGVHVFVFISGYSLFYERQARHGVGFLRFFLGKIKKLSILLLIGMVFAYALRYYNHGLTIEPHIFLEYFVFIITGQANLNANTVFVVSGPFWFFGLMVQLYFIFPVLMIFFDRLKFWWCLALVLFFLLVAAVAYPIGLQSDYFVMANFVGHLPVFVFGLIVAKYGFRSSLLLFVVGLGLFWFLQYVELSFTAWALLFTYLFMSAYFLLKPYWFGLGAVQARVTWAIERIGAISMALFIINGPLRTLSFFKGDTSFLLSEMFPVFLLILLLISIPVAALYKSIRRWDDKKVIF